MTRTRLLVCSVIALLPLRPLMPQDEDLGAVRWLAACWELSSTNRRVVERWSAPANGEMRGNSRTIVGSLESESERLRIYRQGDTLIYDAHPSGQARTEFRARSVTDGEIIFENPEHDFPQRISYQRVGTDSLVARIEGDRAGRRAPVTFAYRRIDCAGFADSPAEVAEAALKVNYDDLMIMLGAPVNGQNSWIAKYARPDFTYMFWASGGFRPGMITREQVDRILRASEGRPATSSITDRASRFTIEQSHVRGDTADVLVTLRIAFTFVDTPGTYGPAGERRARVMEQTRLDRWVRSGQKWVITNAALVAEDVFIDGRLVQRNGRPVGGRQ